MVASSDRVVWCGVCAHGGALLALHPGPAGLVGAAFVAWGWRALSRRWLLLLTVLGLSSGWRLHDALRQADHSYRRAVEAVAATTSCTARGAVVTSPVVLRRGRAGADARFDLRLTSLRCGTTESRFEGDDVRLRLYGGPEELVRGDELVVHGRFAPVRRFENRELRDPRVRLHLTSVYLSGSVRSWRRRDRATGILAWIDGRRARIRSRIEATYPVSIAPFARALILGENDLNAGDRDAFRRSGLAHLLAVSGTHLVLAVLAVVRLLEAVLCRWGPLARRYDTRRGAAVCGVLFAWGYAELAGGGGSANRAALMMGTFLAVRAFGRHPRSARAFGWSLLVPVLVEPGAILDFSYALSAAATGGLFAAQRFAGPRGPLRLIWAPVVATLAATLACAPLLLLLGPEMPLLGVVANLIAGPPGELVALPVGLVHAVLASWPEAEQGAAIVAGAALAAVRAIARVTSDSPYATLSLPAPSPWQLAIAGWGALAYLDRAGRRRRAHVGLALVGVVALGISPPAEAELRIAVLDVGQGDALLVDLPDGRLMAIDGGGLVGSPIDTAERVLLPVLRTRGRRRIDVMVLSHPHPDHYLGLLTLLKHVEVGEFWRPGLELKKDGRLSAALASIPRLRTAASLCGRAPLAGRGPHAAWKVEVLHPCPRADASWSANDNSLVLRLQMGARVALLAGDAELEAERALMVEPSRLEADFLKVGHHGSRTSTHGSFVDAVRPGVAAISCGVRNRFGHPHARALAALFSRGVEVRRTDRGGEIQWRTDGQGAWVRQGFGPWLAR
ncbi:MAG: DNA internalization-related competence protein ComEC/Rec2 [Myxococcota bacterium]